LLKQYSELVQPKQAVQQEQRMHARNLSLVLSQTYRAAAMIIISALHVAAYASMDDHNSRHMPCLCRNDFCMQKSHTLHTCCLLQVKKEVPVEKIVEKVVEVSA
jgi:hypothetical protein